MFLWNPQAHSPALAENGLGRPIPETRRHRSIEPPLGGLRQGTRAYQRDMTRPAAIDRQRSPDASGPLALLPFAIFRTVLIIGDPEVPPACSMLAASSAIAFAM